MNVPWSEATGAAIGADFLLAVLAPSGAFGRRARERERAYLRGDEAVARAALQRVDAVAHALGTEHLTALRATLATAPDPGPALVRASGGSVLGDVDFFELFRFLDGVAQIALQAELPASAALDVPRELVELRAVLAPGRTPERTFYLDDSFDAALARARGRAAAAQADYDAARSRLAARVAQYAGIERVRDGEFVIMRERMHAPLPPEIRVVREAPTYVLCEVALDAAALAALAARDAAVAQVAAREEALRTRLTHAVASAAPALARVCTALGELDVLLARAEFAQRYACAVPEISDVTGSAFEGARFLPLALALERRGRRYAPVSLALDGMGVVTGPNMGGKTAALRTLGFVTACVSLGVPVPAASARLSLVDDVVWLGIGALPADDALLSAFGAEVVEVQTFLARPPAAALVLVDEFARTTSPREGRALLVALLETLATRGALGLAATHLSGIAAAAGIAHYASGGLRAIPVRTNEPLPLEAALARIAEAMEYRIVRVEESAALASDAIALADALGLDVRLIARAKRALLEPG